MKLDKVRSMLLGCILLLVHNALTGWQDVYRAVTFRTLDVAFVTGTSFLVVSVVYYAAYRLRRITASLRTIDFFFINGVTAGSWGSIFVAIWLAPPVIVTCVAAATSPLFTAIFSRCINRNTGVETSAIVVCLLILVLTLLPVANDRSIVTNVAVGNAAAAVGIALALVGAAFDAITSIFTKSLYDKGVHSAELLAKRFILLTALSLCVSVTRGTFHLSSSHVVEPLTIALLGVLPAVYLLQKSLIYLDAILFEILISTVPAFVLVFQMCSSTFKTNSSMVVCTCLIVIVSGLYGIRQTLRSAYA